MARDPEISNSDISTLSKSNSSLLNQTKIKKESLLKIYLLAQSILSRNIETLSQYHDDNCTQEYILYKNGMIERVASFFEFTNDGFKNNPNINNSAFVFIDLEYITTSSDSQEFTAEERTIDFIMSLCSFFLLASILQFNTNKTEIKSLYYDSRTRLLMRSLINHLYNDETEKDEERNTKMKAVLLFEIEFKTSQVLWENGNSTDKLEDGEEVEEAPEEIERRKKQKLKTWFKLGAATVLGTVALGVTGGLAAPLVGAGLGAVFTGVGIGGTVGLTTFLASTGGVVLLTTFFGISGGGITAWKYNRRLKGIDEFGFHSLIAQPHSLNIVISISGWLNDLEDIHSPWDTLGIFAPQSECVALVFESEHLLNLGTALQDFVQSTAVSVTATSFLKLTFFSTLLAGLVWPIGLLQLSYLVDNPWSMALNRSRKAGIILASEVISKNVHGNRPVSLVGYSMGARVIYYACIELARLKKYGFIDSIYLAGAPVVFSTTNSEDTEEGSFFQVRKVVSGRIVNGFSKKDWLLGFLYRGTKFGRGMKIAGLEPILIDGIENVDLGDVVDGHLRYKEKVGEVLERFEFERDKVLVIE